MQQAGINQESLIVITTNAEYDSDLTMAARMYWQIKYFGHDQVSILDGGTAQWILDGRAVDSSLSKSNVGDWKAQQERSELLATSEEVAKAAKNNIQLVDVRPLGSIWVPTRAQKSVQKAIFLAPRCIQWI